jgi:hypothetical protein
MNMAYTGFAGEYSQERAGAFSLRRWVASVFHPMAKADGSEKPAAGRALFGPLPGDARAKGYMGDLDIEVGF